MAFRKGYEIIALCRHRDPRSRETVRGGAAGFSGSAGSGLAGAADTEQNQPQLKIRHDDA